MYYTIFILFITLVHTTFSQTLSTPSRYIKLTFSNPHDAEIYEKSENERKEALVAARQNCNYKEIISLLNIQGTPPKCVEEYIVDLIPLWGNPTTVTQFLCEHLSADSHFEFQRYAYPYFFDGNGIIKLFKNQNEKIQKNTIPESINNEKSKSARFLLNLLIHIPPQEDAYIEKQVEKIITEIKVSLEDTEIAPTILYLAIKRFLALVDPQTDKTILELVVCSPPKDELNRELWKYFLRKIESMIKEKENNQTSNLTQDNELFNRKQFNFLNECLRELHFKKPQTGEIIPVAMLSPEELASYQKENTTPYLDRLLSDTPLIDF